MSVTLHKHRTPQEEFEKLGELYPTGEYISNEDTYWFTVIIGFDGYEVDITWFLNYKYD